MISPLLGLSLVLVCGSALAAVSFPYVWAINFAADGEASILIVPDGSGPPLTEARTSDGALTDATIEITLIDLYGAPIPYYPREDMWLHWYENPGTVTGCSTYPSYPGGVFAADAATDAMGRAYFTQPLGGGGWSDGQVTVFVEGQPALNVGGWQEPPLPLRANSPDFNGDRLVNLTDITLFIQDYGSEYAYRGDFNWDGVINLSDIALMSQAIGVVCP